MIDITIKWQDKALLWNDYCLQDIIYHSRDHAIALFNRNVYRDDMGVIKGIPVIAREENTYIVNFAEIFDKYKAAKKPVQLFSTLSPSNGLLREVGFLG